MNLWEKIENIREKPETVRLRYVWGLTAFGVFFVIVIWIFSLRVNFSHTKLVPETNDTQNLMKKFQESGQAISEIKKMNLTSNSSEISNPTVSPSDSLLNVPTDPLK